MSWWVKVRRKLIFCLTVVSFLSLLFFCILQTEQKKRHRRPHTKLLRPAAEETELYIPARRVVHLDFKGSPPKVSYLEKVFPMIRAAGGTDILIEWEDMFPYSGSLKNASATTAYTLAEVQEILGLAELNSLGVIPLVQTFGHMEHVLKIKEFAHLREDESSPQSICPNRRGSLEVVREMIDQILAVHTSSTHIHIGCDEVYQLAVCSLCSDKARKLSAKSSTVGKKSVFLQHIRHVSEYIAEKQPGVRPIIWDDMLRDVFSTDIIQYKLGELVDLMVWVYVEDIDHFIDSNTWETYSQAFPNIWAASAFKGAFGESVFMPNLYRHFNNHLSWLKVMERESGKLSSGEPIHFKGIALTGWSRYDHFAVLCELLPVALPSLVLNLITVTNPPHLDTEVHSILKCPQTVPHITQKRLRQDPLQGDLRHCSFPGSQLFGLVSNLQSYKSEVEGLVKNLRARSGWLTSYNIRHNFSSPAKVKAKEKQVFSISRTLVEFSREVGKGLKEIFGEETTVEWLEQNINPLRLMLESLEKDIHSVSVRREWPRRPVNSRSLSDEMQKWILSNNVT